eukprot:TRINITY_DN20214_c0_g1_i1.p1 TRINITY_DN20214_c0_g1~~TRINITY_DN20214_c0_g1_i1.p1  ORF type:complete len:1042 (+),score=101.64 TRINITY_DN20214_c0_g1_i1:41-3127(+)
MAITNAHIFFVACSIGTLHASFDEHVSTVTARMRSELISACTRTACWRHSNTSESIKNSTDCHARLLAYEFSLSLIPLRAPQVEVFDALELESCGITRPSDSPAAPVRLNISSHGTIMYVDAKDGSDVHGTGDIRSPFATVKKGVVALRSSQAPRTLILRSGVHYLKETLELTPADSGLTISAHPSGEEETWISGGQLLPPLAWVKVPGAVRNLYKAQLPKSVGGVTAGLQTLFPHRRVTRARYPNGDPELCTDCWHHDEMKLWHKNLSCVGKARVVYKNLVDCNNDMLLPDGTPCKNDSAMWDSYNTYSNGHGGCCSVWSGDQSPYGPMGSYFCGNSSAGGWVGFNDPRQENHTQGLSPALPVGFDYDVSKHPEIATWKNVAGAVLHVWRAQGWFVNMFELEKHNASSHSVSFAQTPGGWAKGGWQGGRGWKVDHSKINSTTENYMQAGQWMIENVLEAVDAPNEYFYDSETHTLYMIPNSTDDSPPNPNLRLVAGKLQTLISINSTAASPIRDITIQGLRFRDAADVSMEPWGVPSGGDWGLYRGGALFLEGTEGCAVRHCSFVRLDNNAIFLSGYNRHTTFADNEFAWLGLSAMAAWGYTRENDGTDGQQPRYTKIERNYVREIGIIQKQSSMWFQAKSCLTTLDSNVAFNQPRAAINFNDGFGGGNNVTRNLLFNTCRETSDHGPINSWDRNAFISDVLTGKPSYTSQTSHVDHNMMIANYGASQGFDTDDGSSWYDIHDNFLFQSDGWKMDFGGHDSSFHDNIIYQEGGDGQNCINTASFLPGHGAKWYNNKCVLSDSKNIGSTSGCDCPGPAAARGSGVDPPQGECGVDLYSNAYFARPELPGNLTITCGGAKLINDWFASGSDKNSFAYQLPSDDLLMSWAREKLNLPPAPGPRPPLPPLLPVKPPATYPHTCVGQCWQQGHCCADMVSGCQQPSCYQGCALAALSPSLAGCLDTCHAVTGKCSYAYKNLTLNMCNMCSSVKPPQECAHSGTCENVEACQDGCKNHFQPHKLSLEGTPTFI